MNTQNIEPTAAGTYAKGTLISQIQEIVKVQIPRVLGFGNRQSGEATTGCFDRYYWHYKLHDLPNLRFQEVAHLLGLLHTTPGFAPFSNNQNILHWMGQAVDFWQQQVHSDGSVDEIYPFERSYCATAFSTFSITEALLLFRPEMDLSAPLKKTLAQTGNWLSAAPTFPIANQWAAGGAALRNIGLLLNDDRYSAESKTQFDRLATLQNSDGGFTEYDGADVGYQSITLSVLRSVTTHRQSEDVVPLLEKGLEWLDQQLDAEARFNPAKYSRGTRYLYLFGATHSSPHSASILEKANTGLAKEVLQHPGWLDDRYCIAYLIDYLQTFRTLISTDTEAA